MRKANDKSMWVFNINKIANKPTESGLRQRTEDIGIKGNIISICSSAKIFL